MQRSSFEGAPLEAAFWRRGDFSLLNGEREVFGGLVAGEDADAQTRRKRQRSTAKVKFSNEEDEALLKKARGEIFKEKSWPEACFEMFGERFNARQCLQRLLASLYAPETSADEDQKLMFLVTQLGDHWQLIADILQTKSSSAHAHRYRQHLEGKHWLQLQGIERKRQSWSKDDDKRLRMAVSAYPNFEWALIAQHFPDRTQVQCRDRWKNVLDPRLGRKSTSSTQKWESFEAQKLEELVKIHGESNWSKVSEALNAFLAESHCDHRRTGQMCRKKFKNRRSSQKQFSEKEFFSEVARAKEEREKD